MRFSLLFLALIASATCTTPKTEGKEDRFDSSVPVEYQVDGNNSSHSHSLDFEISIDWNMLMTINNYTKYYSDSDSDSDSWSLPCSYQLLAIAVIATVLSVLIARYLKRKAKAGDVVHVKNTV